MPEGEAVMITGPYLTVYLDRMRADGEDRIASEIADAVEHDVHNAHHGDEYEMNCWYCWKESQHPDNGCFWPYDGPLPVRWTEA